MCSFGNFLIIICVVFIEINAKKINKDYFGFPETEENPAMVNKENRKPVFLPSMCPENELYYPGDQKDDWICDCRPAFLYHPATDKCWPAYRKGPCQAGEYLVLPANSVIPVCENNPCYVDSYVIWKGKCEMLNTMTPCSSVYPLVTALSVNAQNLTVVCEKVDLESRFGEPAAELPSILCPPGCKRCVNGKCVAIFAGRS